MLQLAITRQLGVAELGLYFLACKLAVLPAEVAGGVVGAVAFPLYARLQDDPRQATRTFQLILIGMVAVLLPAALLLFVLAPALVEHVLGARWQGTVTLVRVLVWVNVIGLLGDAIVPVLKGLGRPSRVTLLELVQYGLLIVLAWELAGRFGLIGAGVTWLVAVAASQIMGMSFLRQLLPQAWVGLAPSLTAVITASSMGAAATWGLVQMDAGLAGLAAAVGGGGLVTGGVLWALDRWLQLNLVDNLRQVFPHVVTLWTVPVQFPPSWLPAARRGGAQ
jgi:O-antigen/teichoic acid export membrane protein